MFAEINGIFGGDSRHRICFSHLLRNAKLSMECVVGFCEVIVLVLIETRANLKWVIEI